VHISTTYYKLNFITEQFQGILITIILNSKFSFLSTISFSVSATDGIAENIIVKLVVYSISLATEKQKDGISLISNRKKDL